MSHQTNRRSHRTSRPRIRRMSHQRIHRRIRCSGGANRRQRSQQPLPRLPERQRQSDEASKNASTCVVFSAEKGKQTQPAGSGHQSLARCRARGIGKDSLPISQIKKMAKSGSPSEGGVFASFLRAFAA